MKKYFQELISDFFILVGSGLVIYATWQLSWIAAIYVAGGILIVLGVLIAIGNRTKGKAPTERGEE